MIFHCCFDLDYLIQRGGARRLAGHVRLPGASELATEAEIITHATVLKAQGFDVMPTCANHDKLGHCKGHDGEVDD